MGIAEAVIIQVHKSSTSFKLLKSKKLQISENEQTITYNLTIKPKKKLVSFNGRRNKFGSLNFKFQGEILEKFWSIILQHNMLIL